MAQLGETQAAEVHRCDTGLFGPEEEGGASDAAAGRVSQHAESFHSD